MNLVLGGGGLVGLATAIGAYVSARRAVTADELIQWLVQAGARNPMSIEVQMRPIGGDARDVRMHVGVPPARFDPNSRTGLAEWGTDQLLTLPVEAPHDQHGRLFVFLSYRSATKPYWTHEAWIPVLPEGEAASMHLRQDARGGLARAWRVLRGGYVLPIAEGIPYLRSSPQRRRSRLRRSQRLGGRLPVPKRIQRAETALLQQGPPPTS